MFISQKFKDGNGTPTSCDNGMGSPIIPKIIEIGTQYSEAYCNTVRPMIIENLVV